MYDTLSPLLLQGGADAEKEGWPEMPEACPRFYCTFATTMFLLSHITGKNPSALSHMACVTSVITMTSRKTHSGHKHTYILSVCHWCNSKIPALGHERTEKASQGESRGCSPGHRTGFGWALRAIIMLPRDHSCPFLGPGQGSQGSFSSPGTYQLWSCFPPTRAHTQPSLCWPPAPVSGFCFPC